MCLVDIRSEPAAPDFAAPESYAAARRDAELALAIDKSLARMPQFDHRFVGVVVWDGAVTVSGLVDSAEAHERVRAAIAEMPGVIAVRDTLRVRKIERA